MPKSNTFLITCICGFVVYSSNHFISRNVNTSIHSLHKSGELIHILSKNLFVFGTYDYSSQGKVNSTDFLKNQKPNNITEYKEVTI